MQATLHGGVSKKRPTKQEIDNVYAQFSIFETYDNDQSHSRIRVVSWSFNVEVTSLLTKEDRELESDSALSGPRQQRRAEDGRQARELCKRLN